MKKMIITFLLVLLISSASYADTYLFGYTPGGQLGGGLRFDLAEGWVTDLSLSADSGDSGSIYQLYGDVFWGNWGAGLTAKRDAVDKDVFFNISLQYAVEQSVNDDIAVGVLLVLADYDTEPGIDPNLHFGSAIVPYFVLGL